MADLRGSEQSATRWTTPSRVSRHARRDILSTMSVRFGVFVPQGWKMDLTEIADPVDQYEAMTAAAQAADAGPWDSIWLYDHFHTVPEPTMETTFESTTLPGGNSLKMVGQGSSKSCLMPRETFFSSWLIERMIASTSSPL